MNRAPTAVARTNLAIIGIAASLLSAPAAAQSVPGAADAARQLQQRKDTPAPPQTPVPPVEMPDRQQSRPSGAADSTPITLTNIVIDGSTVYPASAFATLTQPLVGHPTTLGALFDLATAITQRYRADGYPLSRAVVPAQTLQDGVAHIRVVEGAITRTTVEGSGNRILAAYARAIAASHPLRESMLERYLLLANDLPGMRVRAVLEPDKGVVGGAVLHLIANPAPLFDAAIEVDNQSSKFFGPVEGQVSIGANNLFGLNGRTVLRGNMAFPYRELHSVALSQDVALGSHGLVLSLSGAGDWGQPGFTLRPLGTVIRGAVFDARLTYPIVRSRALTWRGWIAGSLTDDRTVIAGAADVPPSALDRIRTLRAGTALVMDDRSGRLAAQMEFSQGLAIFGASSNDRPNPSRPGGRNDFQKLTMNISRIQSLDWLAKTASIYVSLAGQTSFGRRLLAPEQIGFGGGVLGRGYDPSEIQGDRGIGVTIEPRLNFHLPIPHAPVAGQIYGFFDAGVVGYDHASPQTSNEGLESAGFGLRTVIGSKMSLDLAAAWPLTRVPETEKLANRTGKPLRFAFMVTRSF